jgi:hypothetical protein
MRRLAGHQIDSFQRPFLIPAKSRRLLEVDHPPAGASRDEAKGCSE